MAETRVPAARYVLADRFEMELAAGSGGMGTVYRARDRTDGATVAVKVLHRAREHDEERFSREARLLAELRHPAIVKYVAHGTSPDGESWLAMEWLEGTDLRQRLAGGGRLGVAEAVGLAVRVAGALGTAHARGVVHRDVKPGNLFLRDGEVAAVTLLDFGVARAGALSTTMTQTGVLVGTPGYMAPEQAQGAREVGPRADVFALGCVLYECLAGRPPFAGDTALAVLAKILLEDPPPLRELRPEAPVSLEELVAAMIAKEPAHRPPDGMTVAAALAGLELPDDGAAGATPPVPRPPSITAAEQRLLCVVLAGGPSDAAETSDALFESVVAAVERQGGRVERLAGASLLATLSGARTATDQAARAARCALAMHALVPDAPVALATGRAELAGLLPTGEVIDRAARLLIRATELSGPRSDGEPVIDEVTAGLLGTAFDVRSRDGALVLAGEGAPGEVRRTLLGVATPCVGRERELGVLLGLFQECATEEVARAVLVTAAAGVGKSRLRDELLARLRAARGPGLEIWFARGDPVGAGAPFGLWAQAVRGAAGALDGEALDVRRRKLRARVDRHVPAAQAERVACFLGELCGAPFPDDESVALRTARADPMLMGDWMRRAALDFVGAECAAQPLLIVLEDLHWGDLPSVKIIDGALRALADRPLMVIALARPEVHEQFPHLWMERDVQEIRLAGLARKASEKLVRQVLGDTVAREIVTRVVERADGNAFFLEELIRAVAEGRSDALPGTVLAMVQARLEALEPEARRVLRAAAVFGEVFWRAGVAVLLGDGRTAAHAGDWLSVLVERELCVRRPESRFPGEEELAFRHALVREGAYAMLTESDRRLGHRLAADWLLAAGEGEAMRLAEHLETGGEPARAAPWFVAAAESALEGGDLEAASARADRAEMCGATGDDAGRVHLVRAEAAGWRGDFASAEADALIAMERLPRGSPLWHKAVAGTLLLSSELGHLDVAARLVGALAEAGLDQRLEGSQLLGWAMAARNLLQAGQRALAAPFLERLAQVEREQGASDPVASGWCRMARFFAQIIAEDDPGGALASAESCLARFEESGDNRGRVSGSNAVSWGSLATGDHVRARTLAAANVGEAERQGYLYMAVHARLWLGYALAMEGDAAAARAALDPTAPILARTGNRVQLGMVHTIMAVALSRVGDFGAAAREASAGLDLLANLPPLRVEALAVLAQARLGAGDVAGALAAAREAVEIATSAGTAGLGQSRARLALAGALIATGASAEADAVLTAARDRLRRCAAGIAGDSARRAFLDRVPENARTMALAAERLG